jgi:hypothetical protein
LIARVAQSVERSAVNRKVGGSNPPVSDIFYNCTQSLKDKSAYNESIRKIKLLILLKLVDVLHPDLVDEALH